jgi:hypothetical protein
MSAHYGKFVAYFRVSTDRQGKSGLGLDAQREAVMNYLNGGRWSLVDEFTEVESGKRADRPELEKALAACKKQRARLVIAKLDRLSRNLAFIATLMESGVEFVAVDNPHANKLTIHILAAVAQHERIPPRLQLAGRANLLRLRPRFCARWGACCLPPRQITSGRLKSSRCWNVLRDQSIVLHPKTGAATSLYTECVALALGGRAPRPAGIRPRVGAATGTARMRGANGLCQASTKAPKLRVASRAPGAVSSRSGSAGLGLSKGSLRSRSRGLACILRSRLPTRALLFHAAAALTSSKGCKIAPTCTCVHTPPRAVRTLRH